jgi:hypothetical protein
MNASDQKIRQTSHIRGIQEENKKTEKNMSRAGKSNETELSTKVHSSKSIISSCWSPSIRLFIVPCKVCVVSEFPSHK